MATASQPASPGPARAAGFKLPLGFFPDAWGSTTRRFRGTFESQSFHHLSNSACPLVFSIKVAIDTCNTMGDPRNTGTTASEWKGDTCQLALLLCLGQTAQCGEEKNSQLQVRTISGNGM